VDRNTLDFTGMSDAVMKTQQTEQRAVHRKTLSVKLITIFFLCHYQPRIRGSGQEESTITVLSSLIPAK